MKPSLILIYIILFVTDYLSASTADSMILKKHVEAIISGEGYRNHEDIEALNRTADYIQGEFAKSNTAVSTYDFIVQKNLYKNIITSFGPEDAPRIIIGAHYDVAGNQVGADDNASGVSGLLELARLLSKENHSEWNYRVDLVAYTLEEPPYFRTEYMGSSQHAAYLKANNIPVAGMISIEMIGYYDDKKNSQSYPLGLLKLFYGNRGDFITIVRKWNDGKFCRSFTRGFKNEIAIKTKVFKGPKWLPGIDFSDHLNYWKYDWDALMITDTAFYRNHNYHLVSDTADKLDYARMANVVNSIFNALSQMVS